MKFDSLNLEPDIARAIGDFGYKEMTSIQEKVLPEALKGIDVIGQSPTGSGKTIVFSVPISQNCVKGEGIQALVLCPTRELALQITEVVKDTGKYKHLNVVPVYGGASINVQIEKMKNAEVVVGTPGRVLDHIRRNTMNLSKVKIMVLDEADRMLDMGFITDIKAIVFKTPRNRQTLFFSATIPFPILRLTKMFMKNPQIFKSESQVEKPQIEQSFIEVKQKEKFQTLMALIDVENPQSAIVFVNTKNMADILSANLKKNGVNAKSIHGDLTQNRREIIINLFKSGELKYLVATDVAARGLDIDDVSHIFNYDIPSNGDDYTHRIGRTARAGKKGRAICLLSPDGHDNMRRVHSIHRNVTREELPDFNPEMYLPLDFSVKEDRRHKILSKKKGSKKVARKAFFGKRKPKKRFNKKDGGN